MKKVFTIKKACEGINFPNDPTAADASDLVLLDEIVIPEKQMTIGLYYWPWKNEYVTWVTFDHSNDMEAGKRGVDWGHYFSAHYSSELANESGGLARAIQDLYKRAAKYGWTPEEGSRACR